MATGSYSGYDDPPVDDQLDITYAGGENYPTTRLSDGLGITGGGTGGYTTGQEAFTDPDSPYYDPNYGQVGWQDEGSAGTRLSRGLGITEGGTGGQTPQYRSGDRNPDNPNYVWNSTYNGGNWSYSPQATNANRTGSSVGPTDIWAREPQTPDQGGGAEPLNRPMNKYEALMAKRSQEMKNTAVEAMLAQSTWGAPIDYKMLYDSGYGASKTAQYKANEDYTGMYKDFGLNVLKKMGEGGYEGWIPQDKTPRDESGNPISQVTGQPVIPDPNAPGGGFGDYPGGNDPGGGFGDYPPGGGGDPGGDYPPGGGGGYPPGGGGYPGQGDYPGGDYIPGGGYPGGGYPPGGNDPGLMETIEQYRTDADNYYNQAEGYGPQNYSMDAPETEFVNREVGPNELAGTRLEALLDPNSQMSRRAIQFGEDQAAGRGLMNSSIAGGNSFGAWVDRASPLALDEAGTYRQAASENMLAENSSLMQESVAQLQARLAEMGYDAQRDFQMRGYNLESAADLRRAILNIENREDTQRWGTGERVGSQDWQADQKGRDRWWGTGEREGAQNWQTGERVGSQAWQGGENAADRAWGTGERVGSQTWQGGQNTQDRNLTRTENAANRAFQGLQADKQLQWQSVENQMQQQWTTAERTAIQAYNSGERMDTQNWTAAQQAALNDFTWQRDALQANLTMQGINQQDRNVWMQAWTMVQSGQYNSISNAAAQIYGNTTLTPAQQQAAITNMMEYMGSIAPQMPPPPPGINYDASGNVVYDYGNM